MKQTNQIPGLYDPSFEHDNCGIGACVNIKGVKNHQTVDNALKIVETLEHRAGKDAAGETGDGVGIMLQISHKFFNKACKEAGINIGKEREYGIGMFFFPNDELRLRQAKKMFEIIVEKEGMTFLGWREVPTVPAVLGKKAVECKRSYRDSLQNQQTLKKDLILTVNYILQEKYSNKVMKNLMSFHYPAERSYIKVCS